MKQPSGNTPGKLYLIPVGISEENAEHMLPSHNTLIIKDISCFIVENLRTARRSLRGMGYKRDFAEVTFHELNKHTKEQDIPGFLETALKGGDTGLLSEAGNPCIADPGNRIVRLAHSLDIKVVPLVGPSSILLALIASGFNGQNFAFNGYLPVEKEQRIQKILELQKRVLQKDQTQIFMETPYRNNSILEDVIGACNKNMQLCIASSLGTADEFIKTLSIQEWKEKTPDLHKKPSVFLLYR